MSKSIKWNTKFKPTKIGLFAKLCNRVIIEAIELNSYWCDSRHSWLQHIPTLILTHAKVIYILHFHLFTSKRNQNVMFNNNMSLNCKWIDTDTIGKLEKCEFFSSISPSYFAFVGFGRVCVCVRVIERISFRSFWEWLFIQFPLRGLVTTTKRTSIIYKKKKLVPLENGH